MKYVYILSLMHELGISAISIAVIRNNPISIVNWMIGGSILLVGSMLSFNAVINGKVLEGIADINNRLLAMQMKPIENIREVITEDKKTFEEIEKLKKDEQENNMLKDYIKANLEKGFSLENIKTALLSKYSKEKVEQLLNEIKLKLPELPASPKLSETKIQTESEIKPLKEKEDILTAYCVKCRKNVFVVNGQEGKTKYGVKLLKGVCGTCGTKLSRMLGK